jgi:hypothetical protein
MSDAHDEYAMLQAFGGACSLGMDALRLSIGQQPKKHSPETIAAWFAYLASRQALAKIKGGER